MEEEIYKKTKELKEMNKLRDELKVSKGMEEALQKKLASVEGQNKDQALKVAELERYK